MNKNKLNKEEQEILDAYERGELKPAPDAEEMKEKLRKGAQVTRAQKRTVSIRLPEKDLEKLKAKAMEKGIPYQTLIVSILHQYSDGASLVKDGNGEDVI